MIIFFIQRMMLPINYEKQTEHCPPEQTSGALQDGSAPHKRKVVRNEGHPRGYIVQLITPSVPAMAVSTVISNFKISFQLIFMSIFLKVRG